MHTEVNTMRKTIYVKSKQAWDKVKLVAEQGGISVSELIMAQFTGEISRSHLGRVDQLDRIESKLDLLIPKGMPKSLADGRKEANPEKYESHKPMIVDSEVSKIQDKMGSSGIDPSLLANSNFLPGLSAANSEEAKAFNKQFEDEEIKQANERLLKKRIETKKGPVKANAAMDNFFNGGYSKDKQLGKKGAK